MTPSFNPVESLRKHAASQGKSPVFEAVALGSLEALSSAIEDRWNINDKRNSDGLSPFLFALNRREFSLARYMIERGANVLETAVNGKTSLHFAIHAEQARSQLETKRELSDEEVSLDLTVAPGDSEQDESAEMIKDLIEMRVDVNAKDHNGNTPLHTASRRGNSFAVRTLLQKGAKIDDVDNPGHSAIHYAAYNGFVRVVDLLIELGANWAAQTKKGATALHMAAMSDSIDVADRLLVFFLRAQCSQAPAPPTP
jgi:serine/threonine-protein phosphatase 6 regulatory ankyrin repeat subunit B